MLYIYVETEEKLDGTVVHSLCLGTEEFDEAAFVVQRSSDEFFINSQANVLANKLREGGAAVQLH